MSGLKGTLASGAGKALPGAAGEMASLNEGGLCPGLSITDRFKYFMLSIAVGILFLFLGIMAMSMVQIKAFAFYFTISNAAFVVGTFFIKSPKSQFQKMMKKKERLYAFIAYICLAILTIAIIMTGVDGPTKIMKIVVVFGAGVAQVLAFWFYIVSYIPYGQAGAKKLAQQVMK